MKKIVALAIAALALIVAAPAAAHYDAKDCSDFSSQRAAQSWFLKHHPRQDPAGLDADHDGIACEDLNAGDARNVLELRRGTPPNVVGLNLVVAEERLRSAGWTPRPFNTDTVFGIVIPSHYTVCHEYRPIGIKVRLLAQKYGC
jgi:Excalibur calcium-binding domain